VGWLAVMAVVALGSAVTVATCAATVVRGNLFVLVRAPVGLLCAYWIGVGAWRRTSWGRVTVDTEARGPLLDSSHVRRLIYAAAAVPILLALVLAAQVLVGRS
jgi:hypothetical protein